MSLTPVTTQPPSLVSTLAASATRHLITAASAGLVTAGVLLPGQQNELVVYGVGIVGVAVSLAWSWFTHNNQTKNTAVLVSTVANLVSLNQPSNLNEAAK